MKDTELEIDGHVVSFDDEAYLPGGPTPEAREFAAGLVRRLDEVRAFAAAELLALYNDGWRGDDEPALDRAGFCARLNVTYIDIWGPGEATILFDPSGMFTDHCVQVTIEGGRMVGAEIEG